MTKHLQIALEDIPSSDLESYIRNLAQKFSIYYIKTYADQWAEAVTRLADDEVQNDDVEKLAIELNRQGIINKKDMITLLTYYLRENKMA